MKNIRLKFPSQLSGYINDVKSIQFEGETIRDLLDYLDKTYGNVKERLVEESEDIRPYLQLFIGKKNITALNALDSEISNEDTFTVLLSRAGG